MAAASGRVKVVAQVSITAGPAEVFKYMGDLKYHFLWNPHLQKISPIKVLKTGTIYESSSILLGVKVKSENKVTKLTPGKELQIENQTGVIRYSVNYKLQADGRHTTIVCTTTVDTDYKPLHFADSIMKALAKRELQSDLQALKLAVEHKIQN